MIINKRPIITWLLDDTTEAIPDDVVVSPTYVRDNAENLQERLNALAEIKKLRPYWGLPELVMPSFEKVMEKSQPAFVKIYPKLYEEFSNEDECGILICKGLYTLVYGYGDNELHVWSFYEHNGKSYLNMYSDFQSIDTINRVLCNENLLKDPMLCRGDFETNLNELGFFGSFISCYVAVKKYVQVETVIIPLGKFTAIEGTPLEYVEKKKVINKSGQEVIVMDSKWFRKIINNNDIFVRGFFRMQNKKNADGEWYKELIFVESFVRHGYHRDAKIEDEENLD